MGNIRHWVMTGSPSDELQIAPVVNYEPFTPLEAIRHSYLQDFALKLQKSESSLIFTSPSAVITKMNSFYRKKKRK